MACGVVGQFNGLVGQAVLESNTGFNSHGSEPWEARRIDIAGAVAGEGDILLERRHRTLRAKRSIPILSSSSSF